MTCFDWQNSVSDYLDGVLTGQAKRDADHHLEDCKECSDRHKHYRLILTSIASQPRSALPVPIRKAPLSASLPRMDLSRIGRSRWEQVPWYIRTTAEGTGIVLLILLGISAGPKIRALAERNLERNLSEFNEAVSTNDFMAETAALNLPLGRGKTAGEDRGRTHGTGEETGHGDEFASEGEGGDEESVGDGLPSAGLGSSATAEAEDSQPDPAEAAEEEEMDIRVGSQEIWRFNMKTDSPHEIRPKIVQLLSELKIPATTPGLGGTEAPGGIQFDLMLPQAVVPSLMKQLQKLAPPTPDGLSGSPVGETFTWYKNKSRRRIPAGQTHVVIWLSQI